MYITLEQESLRRGVGHDQGSYDVAPAHVAVYTVMIDASGTSSRQSAPNAHTRSRLQADTEAQQCTHQLYASSHSCAANLSSPDNGEWRLALSVSEVTWTCRCEESAERTG
jgi:hypothetical protein